MLIVPLGMFYVGYVFIFKGTCRSDWLAGWLAPLKGISSTHHCVLLQVENVLYSTIAAIVAVNVLLFGYVLVAILEGDEDDQEGDIGKRKL